jgi:glycosyltransferase involved in cell wall biosynthesis
MKILKIIDQWGWAYHFLSQEQQKYTEHTINIVRIADFRISHLEGYDIIYFSSPDLSKVVNRLIPAIRKSYPKVIIIGGVAGETNSIYVDVDLVISISAKFYPKLKGIYKRCPVIFMPEGIDTKFFVPQEKHKEFIVGWVGRPCTVKRPHLLDELNYSVKKQQDWGHSHFIKDRTQEHMLDFYKSISCLVLTSSSECMPRVVLEAMACERPVISTDVGSLRMVIDSKWLVDVNPESRVILQMNTRLNLLENNRLEYCQVSKRNRDHVVEHFSWEVLQPIWDMIFEYSKKDMRDVVRIGESVRDKYKKDEPALL